MRLLSLVLVVFFSGLLWSTLTLCVERWNLSDRRRDVPHDLPRLRNSYNSTLRKVVWRIRRRLYWMGAIVITVLLLECL